MGQRRETPATVEELLALPEEERYEIVGGELVAKEAARGEHGHAQVKLSARLEPFHRRSGGPPERPGGWWFASEVLIDFGPAQKRRPDVVGWRRERAPERPAGAPISLTPDWICEILSPSNASDDTVDKMRLYHGARVGHYWIVDPRDETLAVYRWHEGGYLHVLGAVRGDHVHAEPFNAMELPVAALFGDDDE